MKIGEIISTLELLAPPSLQENYDNAGLITGNKKLGTCATVARYG